MSGLSISSSWSSTCAACNLALLVTHSQSWHERDWLCYKQAHHSDLLGSANNAACQHLPSLSSKTSCLAGTVTGSSEIRHIRQAACCQQGIAKAGVGILGDAHKLQRDYGIACEGLWDIYQHLQDRADSPAGGRGLASRLMPTLSAASPPGGIGKAATMLQPPGTAWLI